MKRRAKNFVRLVALALAMLMLSGEEQIALTELFLTRCGVMLFAVDFLFVFRNACQGMGKPFLPMLSGILEMILRVAVIALLTRSIGFTAAAYAEIAAWIGALSVNLAAFVYHIKKETAAYGEHSAEIYQYTACKGKIGNNA